MLLLVQLQPGGEVQQPLTSSPVLLRLWQHCLTPPHMWMPCSDGISLRAMNLPAQQDGVRDSSQAAAYVEQLK